TGNLTLTNTTGTHTYTLTARPVERATLTWTVTGATTLTLITPDGDQTVTGKTSHTVTAPGAYTLRATNLDGKHTTSSPLIVSWPASVTKNVTITVTAVQPTRPPALDDATLTVLPDPTNPGGIVLDGAIDPNPGTTGHATTFEEEKLFLLTATDLAGPWTVAAPSTWTAVISDEAHALQLIIAPLPPATPARFYRVATTLRPVDSSTGAPATGDTIRYDTTLIGHYRITIPAGQVKLIACQLDTTGTGVIKLTALIPAAPGGTIATRWNAGQEQSALMGRQSWSGPFDIRTGDTIRVTNPAATPLTLTVTGTVPHTATTTLTGGALNARSSVLPVAGAITGFGLTPGSSDYLTETAAGAYQAHLYGRSGWSGDAPAFRIGEGFLYHRNSTQAATWKQTITVTTDTPDITIVK
ncbi:MAG: hypothetical protein LBK99_08030, partial [Opitutaceae bacterium]|nr:hypothetical protein [Opitutaceae bacterium]